VHSRNAASLPKQLPHGDARRPSGAVLTRLIYVFHLNRVGLLVARGGSSVLFGLSNTEQAWPGGGKAVKHAVDS
jgi:hypothetical protein